MADQLPIFKRRTFPKVAPQQIVEPVAPTGESSVMSTLPAYKAFLYGQGYSESTIEKYFADVRQFSLFIRNKTLEEITEHDVEQWIETLVTKKGETLDKKTIARKISAIINYFSWLMHLEVLEEDPTSSITNGRIRSPLPDYLYDNEVKILYQEASNDPRTYLLVTLLLETGMKSNELLNLRTADIDVSDQFAADVWIKHKGKGVKKDRKVSLKRAPQFAEAYRQYTERFPVQDILFPYTDRFIQMLFAELKKQTNIDKELTPKTLRHTHVVQSYKRGENKEEIFDRIGLAQHSRIEADEVYSKLASRGI